MQKVCDADSLVLFCKRPLDNVALLQKEGAFVLSLMQGLVEVSLEEI